MRRRTAKSSQRFWTVCSFVVGAGKVDLFIRFVVTVKVGIAIGGGPHVHSYFD